jgi:hypothetical protein
MICNLRMKLSPGIIINLQEKGTIQNPGANWNMKGYIL